MPIDRYSATAAAAAANNVILAKGQLGYTADDDVLKVGDGVRHWNDLEAVGGGGGGGITQEQLEDFVGAMVTGNTETGLSLTYDDTLGKLNAVNGYTDESIQDLVGAMVTGNTETNITVTYDDAAAKLNFVASGGATYINEVAAPGSPNAKDDEFDGTSSVTWVDGPYAPTTVSRNGTVPGRLLLAGVPTTNSIPSRLQAVPGAYPYTLTTRVVSAMTDANYRGGGLVLAPASPTTTSTIVFTAAKAHNGPTINRWKGTFAGTFTDETTVGLGANALPIYLRLTVNSATSVTHEWSKDGLYWVAVDTALNPGFTPAFMGLGITDNTTAWATFDFFRVT